MASTSPNPKLKRRIVSGETPAWLLRHPRSRYITAYVLSVPLSTTKADLAKMKLLAYQAVCLSELTGVRHVVDHEVPLNHPRVCGLTVPWNLKVTTAAANAHKSNHIHLDDQLELFPS